MNAKHTPGPWYWTREKINDTWHCFLRGKPNHHNDDLITAMRDDLASFPYAIGTANARLIAAAPALAEALEDLLDIVDRHTHGGKPIGFWKDDAAKQETARAALRAAGLE